MEVGTRESLGKQVQRSIPVHSSSLEEKVRFPRVQVQRVVELPRGSHHEKVGEVVEFSHEKVGAVIEFSHEKVDGEVVTHEEANLNLELMVKVVLVLIIAYVQANVFHP